MFSFVTIALTLLVFALQIRFSRHSHYLIGASRLILVLVPPLIPPCSHPQWCWKACHPLSDCHYPAISTALSILFKSILKTLECKLSSPCIRLGQCINLIAVSYINWPRSFFHTPSIAKKFHLCLFAYMRLLLTLSASFLATLQCEDGCTASAMTLEVI